MGIFPCKIEGENMLQGIIISLTGFFVVFVILLILYIIVNLLRLISTNSNEISNELMNNTLKGGGESSVDEYQEIGAVMAVVSQLLKDREYQINKIYLKNDNRLLWSKEQWQKNNCGRGQT